MKKIILLISVLLMFFLLFSACTPSADPGTEATDESTGSTDSTESTENNAGTNLPEIVFVHHTKGATYDLPGRKVNADIMKAGYLYACASKNMRQVSNSAVDSWCIMDDKVLYVTKEAPSIIRIVEIQYYDGEIKRCDDAIYQDARPGCPVKGMQYVNNQLLLSLRYETNYGVYSSIWASGNSLMGVHQIDAFTYAVNSTEFPDISANISKENLGATICWKGKLQANDTEVREYYFFVETKEFWDAVTFERVPEPVPTLNGRPVVYNTEKDFSNTDVSQCIPGALYYLDCANNEMHFITDEQVALCEMAFGKVLFVKAAEPSKIYAARLDDLTDHKIVYESDFGAITKMAMQDGLVDEMMKVIEGNKRFVMVDITTGTADVVTELYYMIDADFRFYINEDTVLPLENWREADIVLLYGKENEGDPLTEYAYNHFTGKLVAVPTPTNQNL